MPTPRPHTPWWVVVNKGNVRNSAITQGTSKAAVARSFVVPKSEVHGPFFSKASAEIYYRSVIGGHHHVGNPPGNPPPPPPPQQKLGKQSISGPEIAGDAIKYIGHPYSYGGAPGTNGQSGWDCSSFVNWVLGHDLNMRLPGSATPGYSGTSHGPVVMSYATWSRAKTVGKPEAGDLCIWAGVGPSGHIGIAVSPTHMVSALNPALNTAQTPIIGSGPVATPLIFRRITGVISPQGCLPGATIAGSGIGKR
jgi:NlpC/P60 family protein